jgi:pantoate--beta-alanine ligase
VLSRALEEAEQQIQRGERNGERLQRVLAERIALTPGAALDYAAVVDAASLKPATELRGTILLALAVRFGSVRLIDNHIVSVPTDDGSGARAEKKGHRTNG